MDSAVAEFLGVLECSYFRDTDFPKFRFCNGDFNPMLHFFGEWSKEERESTKMSSLTMDDVPNYVSSYFTKWSANIIEYVSTIGNQICLSDLTIQHLASYYGHRGGKGNLGKKKTEEHRANISAGNLGKKNNIHGRPIQVDKWIDNLARVKMFIDTEGRLPRWRAGDADEKQHARWIQNNKLKEKGTNREQLMRRDIPLAFVSNRVQSEMVKWIDNLARVKMFIDTEGRLPRLGAGDADEKKHARWIKSNKHREKGTNREQLMRRDIPLAFA